MTEAELQLLKELLLPIAGAIAGYISGHAHCNHVWKKATNSVLDKKSDE